MKKLFLLAVAAVMSVSVANAQVPVKYQGEVDFGYYDGNSRYRGSYSYDIDNQVCSVSDSNDM